MPGQELEKGLARVGVKAGRPFQGEETLWVKEWERILSTGDCPRLGWWVHGHDGHGIAELVR